MSLTSSANTAASTLTAWTTVMAAFQPLLAAGMVLAGDVVALYKKANPTATDADLNVILMALLSADDAERVAIAQERAAALAEPPVVTSPV